MEPALRSSRRLQPTQVDSAIGMVFLTTTQSLRMLRPEIAGSLLDLLIFLLIAGTFIYFDHYILPYEITIVGIFAGLMGSFWVPRLMEQTEHGRGIVFSFLGASLGLGLLWSVVELGKLAFGRLRHRYEKPV